MTPPPRPSIDVLIDQYLNYLLIEKGLSKATLDSYSRDVIRYREFLHENGIDRLSDNDTPFILKHLIGLRNAGLGTRSRARHLVSIRGLYRFGVQEKYLKTFDGNISELNLLEKMVVVKEGGFVNPKILKSKSLLDS